MKIKETKYIFQLTVVFMLLGFTSHTQAPAQMAHDYPMPVDVCGVDNHAFQDGEEIVYKLYYNWNFVWMSAGEITFKVKERNSHYYLSATGGTYKSYDWFYKVRDKYESKVSKNSLVPFEATRKVQEGNYRLYDKVNFDQGGGKAISKRGESSDKTKTTQYDIESCVHDILSIIYYLRNVPFEKMNKGDKLPLQIFMDGKSWPLSVEYAGIEKDKKVKGLGKFDAIKLSPELIAGDVFNEGDRMYIWASNDLNRLPLLIETPISVGSVKVVLTSYKGLKYDLNALSLK